jgi:hypothetical protein
MAKQLQSVVPAAVMHLPKPRWQANSRATPRALLPANSLMKAADWRPPLLGLQAKAKLLEQQSEKPPLLEPLD